MQARRPLVIIAEDVDEGALAACILDMLCGQLQVAVIKAPGFGDNHTSILGDLAPCSRISRPDIINSAVDDLITLSRQVALWMI